MSTGAGQQGPRSSDKELTTMTTTTTTRRTSCGAALVLAAGLVSTLGAGAAWGETVPTSPTTPTVKATYTHDGGSRATDTWTPADTGAPGIASVASPAAPDASAASSADIALGRLTSSTTSRDNQTPANRIRTASSLVDGFYLAAPATVRLSWTIDGSAASSLPGDGAALTSVDAVVAIDCPMVEDICIPNDANAEGPPVGHRDGDTAEDGVTDLIDSTGSLDIELAAGWHEVLAETSSYSSAVGAGTSSGDITMTFDLEVVDVLGEDPVGWASASDLLPVTGGQEIQDDVPPPPAPTPAQLLGALAADVQAAADAGQIANPRPLLSKIEAARAAEARGDEQAAANALTALRNHLSAQSGKRIPAELATGWSTAAGAVFAQA